MPTVRSANIRRACSNAWGWPRRSSAVGADAVVSLEEEEPEAVRARATVLFRQVTEAFDHICEGHLHSDAVDPAAGPAKSQFSADLGTSRRRLSTLLVRGANHPDALVYFQYEEDKEAKTGATEVTVIEFTAAGTVGRVRNPATRTWSATSRVRVVQKTDPGTGEVFVASAYPIPQIRPGPPPGGSVPAGPGRAGVHPG